MWHEARRSERKVHDMMDAARRRAERRAVFLAKRRGDPQQSLRMVGKHSRMHHDPALYQATQDEQGLIPWNGRKEIMIDRFDGRALLDFIRENDGSSRFHREKTEEEEELEELVNFERYRDLIKHRRSGFTDEEGLEDVDQELETRVTAPLASDRHRGPQSLSSGKGAYAQVGFAYEGEGKEEFSVDSEDEEDDEEEESSSEDSEDEEIERIAREHGVQRFNWLVYMDRKAKEEERKQKEAAKGDPTMRKLSRKERRKASQLEREKEKEAVRLAGTRFSNHDPYREPRRSPTYEAYPRLRRSRSPSHSPACVRRSDRQSFSERALDPDSPTKRTRARPAPARMEYITEFGVADVEGTAGGIAPPSSPPSQFEPMNRLSSGRILEAIHGDPAAVLTASSSAEWERSHKDVKVSATSTSSAIAKLSKPAAIPVAVQKSQQGDRKETPQERLKRIMSKQLNKQIKKDNVTELAKRREQERQRQEKLAETRRIARYKRHSHSRSRSPVRYGRSRSRSRSISRSRSPIRNYPRSPRTY
ncbi:hypothetical protein O6H91_01G001400 [Diphasiastrum complanatum]|uniref:Uncharacterized protein n=2 Tax=Diphasiastrum complanatum TaxID=34168 RepID=A0ACC2EMM2_DIPCM|nr:hypothetical protein O6H91_01G001400 [Diphasiastrum complanatum]KAJ7567668.1 hypothetical protein O6H91_01G001400 [Diphasiastrum complanatum]